MTYRELLASLEVVAVHDAALAMTLGLDAYADQSGTMAKASARRAFSAANRVQQFREWMSRGWRGFDVNGLIDYVR